MKNFYLLILWVVPLMGLFAQENEVKKPLPEKRNELKIDMLQLLAQPALEIEYERIHNNWSSFGGYFRFGDGGEELFRDLRIGGFYRGYFTQSKEYGTKGFYGELLTGYYEGNSWIDYYNNNQSTKYTGLEVGFKLGYKWVNRSGFVLQADIGLSRGIIKDDNSPTNFLLSGVKVGWRF